MVAAWRWVWVVPASGKAATLDPALASCQTGLVQASVGIHHLAVVVSDLERSRRFYVDVLGLPEIRRWSDDRGNDRSIWVQVGPSAFLAIERSDSEEPTRVDQAPGWHCVALSIEPNDRKAWQERFLAAGIEIERESDYTLYVRDPDGNLLGLSHYPEAAPD